MTTLNNVPKNRTFLQKNPEKGDRRGIRKNMTTFDELGLSLTKGSMCHFYGTCRTLGSNV